MAKLKFTRRAVNDLAEIWEYTAANWSESQADKYYRMLIADCQMLSDNPIIGLKYPEISSHLFGLKSGRHIVFYTRIDEDFIEIVRILHEQMDLKNRFLE